MQVKDSRLRIMLVKDGSERIVCRIMQVKDSSERIGDVRSCRVRTSLVPSIAYNNVQNVYS